MPNPKTINWKEWEKGNWISFIAKFLGIENTKEDDYFTEILNPYLKIKPIGKVIQFDKLSCRKIEIPTCYIEIDLNKLSLEVNSLYHFNGFFYKSIHSIIKHNKRKPYFLLREIREIEYCFNCKKMIIGEIFYFGKENNMFCYECNQQIENSFDLERDYFGYSEWEERD